MTENEPVLIVHCELSKIVDRLFELEAAALRSDQFMLAAQCAESADALMVHVR